MASGLVVGLVAVVLAGLVLVAEPSQPVPAPEGLDAAGDSETDASLVADHDAHGDSTAQDRAAEQFRRATIEAMEPFRDLEVALEAGFVRNPDAEGPLAHYRHFGHRRDDNVLDPNALEGLVYAFDLDGNAYLVAALYTARLHEVVEPPGHPIVRWHLHVDGCHHPDHTPGCENVPGMRMLHVWDFPGVQDPFGDGWGDAVGPNPRETLAAAGVDLDMFLPR
jgi:hypothetical protein